MKVENTVLTFEVEIDPESHEEFKKKLTELADIANLIGVNYEAVQHRVRWAVFSYWLMVIPIGFTIGAIAMYLIISCYP